MVTPRATFISVQRVDSKRMDSEWCAFILPTDRKVGFYDDHRWATKRAAKQELRKRFPNAQIVELSTIIRMMEEFTDST